MIQATSLRIGNWISSYAVFGGLPKGMNGEQEIRKVRVDAALLKFLADKEKSVPGPTYNPIPLTPEIILKAGGERIENANNWHFKEFDIYRIGRMLLGYKNQTFYWYNQSEDDMFSTMFPRIQFVHRLQNLHFELTEGEELNIEL